ncbi:bifunctional phosphoribosyl-AMP cyclohydrolase/phosphoribosyl-ATP diphosphatase HisIE [Bacteroidota bacterium]
MSLNFKKMGGILPAIIQDADSAEVLMLGFMNEEAYGKTLSEGKVCFFSRTKNRLWTKGEESGNFLNVVDIREDCDSDTLLIRVKPVGAVCHTGQRTCFGEDQPNNLAFLNRLQDLLHSRKQELPENSYTSKLFKSGVNKIAQKVGEEAVELVIEAKDADDERFLNEAADLLFHMMILLEEKGYGIGDVAGVLQDRH